MSGQQKPGKEPKPSPAARERVEAAEPVPESELAGGVATAWQRAINPMASLGHGDVLSLQRTVGNQTVQRLIARRKERGCCGDNLEEQEAGGARTPAVSVPQLLQRHGNGEVPAATVAAAPTPSALAATPGEAAAGSREGAPTAPVPPEIVTRHGAFITAGNHQEALNVVYNHMVDSGQIDGDLMQTAIHSSNTRAICSTDQLFHFENVDGAFTNFCTPITSGNRQLPNPRIKINQSMVRDAMALHSTLLHEFRHVQQQYSLINHRESSPSGSSDCLYCNNPDETDAYLVEIERGVHTPSMRRAYTRVYVNWDFLAPEQRAVFQSRRDAADAHFNRLYPGINWEVNGEVIAYRQWCENLITQFENAHNLSRPFYCNRAIAPLNPGRISGQPRAEGGSAEGGASGGSGSEERIPTDAGGPTGTVAAPAAEGEAE